MIVTNPAHWVELPSGKRPKAVVWTARRTAVFLTHIRDHPWYPLYHLIALLGLRRGEAAGLRWCDLDLAARVLMVSHQIRDDHGHTVV